MFFKGVRRGTNKRGGEQKVNKISGEYPHNKRGKSTKQSGLTILFVSFCYAFAQTKYFLMVIEQRSLFALS